VARKFVVSRRREKLSFQHHVEVARLPENEQDAWLDQAERGGWSRNQLRRQLRSAQGHAPHGGTAAKSIDLSNVSVSDERRRKWQLAAEQAGLGVIEWVMSVVDRAATDALD
jgi:hypothetical protein